MTILADKDENGNKFLIPNDVDIASDGMIFFLTHLQNINLTEKMHVEFY
jgi:sugar lactone lactonase YvrE